MQTVLIVLAVVLVAAVLLALAWRSSGRAPGREKGSLQNPDNIRSSAAQHYEPPPSQPTMGGGGPV